MYYTRSADWAADIEEDHYKIRGITLLKSGDLKDEINSLFAAQHLAVKECISRREAPSPFRNDYQDSG